jgi:hypothetical protein
LSEHDPKIEVLHILKLRISKLGEEHRLRQFDSRLLKKTFGPTKQDRNGEYFIMMSFMICTTKPI